MRQYRDSFNPEEFSGPAASNKLFTKGQKTVGQLIRLIDDIHDMKPDQYTRDSLFALLESVGSRLEDWRKR